MTTIELKDILIHKIAAINDKSFLAAMNTIIDTKSEKLIYKTTPEQKQRIKEGQEQIARGEAISNDQVEADIDKWLSER
jgi:predicted transcriptional regulator